ncbi:hypothetical protein ACF07T_34240 [Streptomyces sp. NPDC015184]
MPTWSDKLVAEVVRLLLEAHCDVQGVQAQARQIVPAAGCR